MKPNGPLKRRTWIVLAAAGGLGLVAVIGKRLVGNRAPLVGALVAPMKLPVLSNGRGESHIAVPGDQRRILVLDMFETTCGPCKKSLPKAQSRFDSQADVHFVAVCLDEDRTAAEQVAAVWGLNKEVAWDENGEARRQFKVVGIPAMVVIAPNGVVTGNFGYEPSDAEVERALRAARDQT